MDLLKQYRELKRKRTFSWQRKNYLAKVKKRHDSVIKDFLRFCDADSIWGIEQRHYAAYIRMLHSKRKLSPSTIEKTYKYILKRFFSDLGLPVKVRIRGERCE